MIPDVMNLGSFGDREDNQCQEDGQAKLAWRETRVFGDLDCLFFLHCLVKEIQSHPYIDGQT